MNLSEKLKFDILGRLDLLNLKGLIRVDVIQETEEGCLVRDILEENHENIILTLILQLIILVMNPIFQLGFMILKDEEMC